jgi:hypothetical protein
MPSYLKLSAAALVLVSPLLIQAQNLSIKPGAWETSVSTQMTGMPMPAEQLAKMPAEQRARFEKMMQARAGKANTHVTKSCVTQKDLDEDRWLKGKDDGNCTRKIISKSANKIVMEQSCPPPHASFARITSEARSPESYTVSMDMEQTGAAGKMHMDMQSRWLGNSCVGIKE